MDERTRDLRLTSPRPNNSSSRALTMVRYRGRKDSLSSGRRVWRGENSRNLSKRTLITSYSNMIHPSKLLVEEAWWIAGASWFSSVEGGGI